MRNHGEDKMKTRKKQQQQKAKFAFLYFTDIFSRKFHGKE